MTPRVTKPARRGARRRRCWPRAGQSGVFLLALLLGTAAGASATTAPGQPDRQSQIRAATRTLVVAVQQGISSLPPTSGQSFVYDFDPAIDTYVTSSRLGPISFRTPLTVGKGRFSIRVAGSYFDLSEDFEPKPGTNASRADGSLADHDQLGLEASATVGIINVGATYGITDAVEVSLGLPIVVVDPSAEVVTPTTRMRFDLGTSGGLGRVSLAARGLVYSPGALRLAGSLELFMPSPNADEFAGSESTALLPRLIGMYELTETVRLHLDAGYNYDFELSELRSFVWNAGTSIAIPGLTADFGVGGAECDTPVRWPPPSAWSTDGVDLGTTYVDFLGGLKVKIADHAVVGGSVSVPLTSDGFRADAVGTIATEVYF